MQRDVYMPRASKLRKLLVSLDINQHNALVIFAVKRSTISKINLNIDISANLIY